MKILLFGKTRTVTRLTEDIARDLARGGHDVRLFAYRSSKLEKLAEPLLMARALGVPLAALMAWAVRRFAPDLILAIGPFHWLPPEIFEHVAALPGRPPLIAWIGDVFGAGAAVAARPFDLVAYTDSGLPPLHDRFGFHPPRVFMPLAAVRPPGRSGGPEGEPEGEQKGEPEGGPEAKPGDGPGRARLARLAFVASATPHRRALLAKVTTPVALFGPDWRDQAGLERHLRDGRRIGARELAAIYRTHMGILNIRNEENVVNGLNQRHFAPYIAATPVLTDRVADLEVCFEPGAEVFVYDSVDELNGLLDMLARDPDRARTVGLAGQRRVLAHHTYSHRVEALAALVRGR